VAPVKPLLDIIIVNWNAGRYLGTCLDDIRATSYDGFDLKRVVVVDNASSDGSADNLHFPDMPLSIVRNSKNRGFAAACNQGARGSVAQYLLFLNPDVRLGAGSLRAPVQFMEAATNRKIGICGIQLVDESGRVSRTCSWFPTSASLLWQMLGLDRMFPRVFRGHFMEESEHHKSSSVDQVMGAFLLIRRSVFEALGGFDERFFVYWEDVDLGYRAKLLGWSSYYLADAPAFHKGQGCTEQVKDVRLFYSLRSRIIYVWKHFSWLGASLVSLGTVLVEPLSRLVLAGLEGSTRKMKETLRGCVMLWRALPEILASGRRDRLNAQSAGTD
jgi:N-acetylglucosaminyl-diphospho-decaprenol L-rhamnosyltransferase